MTSVRCPICEKPVREAAENPAFPFCSGRCKLVDLGNWLDERYRVPGESVGPDEPHDEDDRRPS